MNGRKLLAGGLAIAMASGSFTMLGTDNAYAKETALQALKSGKATIVEIDQPQEEQVELKYKPCLDSLLDILPDTVSATVSMNSVLKSKTEVEVPVTWECEQDYDESLGEYTFTAVVEDADVEDDVELPTITVTTDNEELDFVQEEELHISNEYEVPARQSSTDSSLPTSYNNYEEGNLPALRNQNPYGTCWTFASIGALEADLIASGQVEDNTSIDLSELALAYFTNHQYDDPKGLHNSDVVYTSSAWDYLSYGGNICFAINSFANNVGAVSEANVPYTTVSQCELAEALAVEVDEEYAVSSNYATMVNYYNIPFTDQDGIKQAIVDHGGVNAAMYMDDGESYCSTNNSYYISDATYANHAIMLVGWDDNFEKENFNEDSQPSEDGAWLVRNSWIDGSDSSNDLYTYHLYGYFWISYEDAGVLSEGDVQAFDAQLDGYDNCYAYDGASGRYYHDVKNGDVLSETYPVDAGEEIKAVRLNVESTDEVLDVTVIAGDQETTASLTTTYQGIYTAEFDEPIVVAEDTDVTVQFTPDSEDGKATFSCEYNEWMEDGYGHVLYGQYPLTTGDSTLNGKELSRDLHVKLFTDTVEDMTTRDLSSAAVTLEETEYSYTSSQIEPEVTVEKDDTTLTKGTDYTVSYENNTDAGEATVTITGKGKYYGTQSKTFTIVTTDISDAEVTFAQDTYGYTGRAVEAEPIVKIGDATYAQGTDYTVAYANNTNLGTATVTITGTGSCTGSTTATFTIGKGTSYIHLKAQKKTYNGKKKSYTGNVTWSGSDGKVTYSYYSDAACTKKISASKVKKAGTYYVKATIAADSNYEAATSAPVKLTIKKAANTMKVSAVKKTAKRVTVKKKAVTLALPMSIKKAKGTVTFKKVSGSSKLTISKKTGKVTVKKGTSSGTYTIKIKVKAAGNNNYKAKSKTITCKVVVK
ncbi:MAG: hypothetical protein K6G01_11220 [Eubacterium sp.]|nr:hypothetical protein [Eubacterium sp.]